MLECQVTYTVVSNVLRMLKFLDVDLVFCKLSAFSFLKEVNGSLFKMKRRLMCINSRVLFKLAEKAALNNDRIDCLGL